MLFRSWLQYFTYKNVAGSFAQANALLSGNEEVLRQVEGKMCSHVLSAVNEVKGKTDRPALTDAEIEELFGHYGQAKTGEEIERERAEKELEEAQRREAAEKRRLELEEKRLLERARAFSQSLKWEASDDLFPF